MLRGAPLLVVLITSGLTACQKSDDGAGKPAPVPPLEQGPAPAAAAPPIAAAPPVAPPAPAAEPPAEPAAAPGGSIAGKIVLGSAVAKTRPQGTLYLVARRISDNPSARGTLIAVKKLPATSFPLPFTLTAADMPFQTGPFDGELTLTARIDQDGDPLTHQKGDVFGSLPKVRVGAHDVKLSLDQVQKETESLAGGGPMMGGGGPMMGGGALPPGHPQ
ncbi:MAG TPA: hypothetical protein VMT03_09090 [Polyangia bacterium]|nr:hypothetical protein [Polyangia bacterium]